jgi:hypothetical protein
MMMDRPSTISSCFLQGGIERNLEKINKQDIKREKILWRNETPNALGVFETTIFLLEWSPLFLLFFFCGVI